MTRPRPTDHDLVTRAAGAGPLGTRPPGPVPDEDPGTAADRDRHERFVATADDAGLLDLGFRTTDSPIGALLLVASPAGVVRVAFAVEDHDRVLAELAASVSPRLLRAPARLDPAARQLDEYFQGVRRSFDVPIDLRLARGFRLEVLEQLRAIAYGATASYAEVARAAGHPRAVRAVGSACSHNPVPVLVPCHRVVRSDGTIGQYLGGAEAKRALLTLESAN